VDEEEGSREGVSGTEQSSSVAEAMGRKESCGPCVVYVCVYVICVCVCLCA